MIKSPQTKCTYLSAHYNKLQAIANFGCLAMCYLYCAGIDGDEIDYILNVAKAMDEDLLDKECTVLDAEKYLNAFTGRKCSVNKKPVTELKLIHEPTPVRFDYKNSSHWVVVEDGRVIFNPLINSICVAKGKPTTMRCIKWV